MGGYCVWMDSYPVEEDALTVELEFDVKGLVVHVLHRVFDVPSAGEHGQERAKQLDALLGRAHVGVCELCADLDNVRTDVVDVVGVRVEALQNRSLSHAHLECFQDDLDDPLVFECRHPRDKHPEDLLLLLRLWFAIACLLL